MLGRANREVWRNCPASEKKVEHGYVCGETIKAEYCRRAIEDLFTRVFACLSIEARRGMEGKASNKEFSKQISAWYCGIGLRICTGEWIAELRNPVWNSLGTCNVEKDVEIELGQLRGRSGVPASFYVMPAAIPRE